MSRSDPQFNLRIPVDLRDEVMEAAHLNNRSATAEIISRLQSTFKHGVTLEKLVPAAKARELSLVARQRIPDIVRQRIIKAISKAVELGHSATSVEFDDLQLDGGLSDEEAADLLHGVDEELLNAGYEVLWDGASAVTIFLWPQSGS